jgi:AGCS family alanine or glycine:cation symporter
MQSAAIYDLVNLRGENRMIFAFLFCIFIAFSVIGGTEKIEKITSFIIPVTTIIYILLSFSVVLSNLSSLDDAILCVFKNAFTPTATVGGTVGFLSSKAIKEGFARGILSNEAGLGTSAMAHVRGGGRRAAEAGLYGMCEVFFDTVLLCPLTALMILVSGVDLNAYDPMHLVRASVCTTIGEPFGYILGLLILGFGYSTVCCWFYYGEECFCYLFGDACKKAFIVFYLLFVMLGAILDRLFIVFLTDSFILAMSFVMSALLLKEIKTVRNATREIGLLKTDVRVF